MDLQDEIYRSYEGQLAAIAALDRAYYLNENPTLADRAAYAARVEEREAIRNRFYAELDVVCRAAPFRRPD